MERNTADSIAAPRRNFEADSPMTARSTSRSRASCCCPCGLAPVVTVAAGTTWGHATPCYDSHHMMLVLLYGMAHNTYPTLKPRQFFHTKTKISRTSGHPLTQTVNFFFLACSNQKLASLEINKNAKIEHKKNTKLFGVAKIPGSSSVCDPPTYCRYEYSARRFFSSQVQHPKPDFEKENEKSRGRVLLQKITNNSSPSILGVHLQYPHFGQKKVRYPYFGQRKVHATI